MPYLLSTDSFVRANGAIGSTDGAGFLDPIPWVMQKGSWIILTNRAAVSTQGVGVFPPAIATVDLQTGNANAAITKITATADDYWFIFRFVDLLNFCFILAGNTQFKLGHYVAGVQTLGTNLTTLNVGESFGVVASGPNVQAMKNGVAVGASVVDTNFLTATKWGMGIDDSVPEPLGKFNAWTATSIDDLIVPFKNPPVITGGTINLATTFPIHTPTGPNVALNAFVTLPNPIAYEAYYPISTNSTIAIPPGTTSITVSPLPTNTIPITLKGAGPDTGIALAVNQPTAFCVDAAAHAFVLNSPSPINVQITFL